MAVFGLGMSIYSFSNTLRSYSIMANTVGQFKSVISNWNGVPLDDVKVISSGSTCPAGYSEGVVSDDRTAKVPQTVGQFPGSYDWCECGSNGFEWRFQYREYSCDCSSCKKTSSNSKRCPSSSSGRCTDRRCTEKKGALKWKTELWKTKKGACSTNATKAGCKTDTGLQAQPLSKIDDRKICYKRSGKSALARASATATGCPANTKNCNNGGDDSKTFICVATTDACPLTAVIGGFGGDVLITSTGGSLPIVEVRVTPGPVCVLNDAGSEGIAGRQNNDRIKKKFDTGCIKNDPRYVLWHSFPESFYYKNNSIGTTGGQSLTGKFNQQTYTETSPVQRFDIYSDPWRISYRTQIAWKASCGGTDLSGIEKKMQPVSQIKVYIQLFF